MKLKKSDIVALALFLVVGITAIAITTYRRSVREHSTYQEMECSGCACTHHHS